VLSAVVAQRCPRCREGLVFAGSITMNATCPRCGLAFGREPGYYLGAMYFGYGLGALVLGLLLLAAWWIWPAWELHHLLLVALLAFLPFLPVIFRYSRVIWLHFDHVFDPR
jgi:uncharacterized protein (DUF983 family)